MPFWTLRRKLGAAGVVVLLLAFGWAAVVVAVALAGAHDQATTADAIAVLGAAQYNGRPSPVFRARLDHAAALYQRGLAPVVLVTGGVGSGDTVSESEVGRRYLVKAGLPDGAVVGLPAGAGTSAPLPRVAPGVTGKGNPRGPRRARRALATGGRPRPHGSWDSASAGTGGGVRCGRSRPARSIRGKSPAGVPAVSCSRRRGSPPAACGG